MNETFIMVFVILFFLAIVFICYCFFNSMVFLELIAGALEHILNTAKLSDQRVQASNRETAEAREFLKEFLDKMVKMMFPVPPEKKKSKSIFKKEVIKND